MLKFLTGAAAIALAATAVSADPGGGKGGDKGQGGQGGGKDHAAHAQGSPGGDNAKQDRGAKPDQAKGSSKEHEARADARGRGNDDVRKSQGKAGRGAAVVREASGRDDDRIRGDRVRDVRVVRDDRRGFDWDDLDGDRSRGLIGGCPPGLAKKDNGCMPPGLVKNRMAFWDRADWWNFDRAGSDWDDGRYRYYDGYMVRYGDRGIESWMPLLGGALAPGNLWPSQYGLVDLPPYYEDYYGLGSPDGYRYNDDTLFRIDPQSNAITAIAALLTGNTFDVGQRMPLGYEVYNVPYSYRDRYVDGPDAYYRYSDGYVYEVDPTTQLIQAAIELLA